MIGRKQIQELAWPIVLSWALSLPLTTAALAQPVNGDSLPPTSVYNLQVLVEDQFGDFSGLDRYKGMPVLVTMFYASCPHVCPLLISTVQLLESELSDDERANLRVLTVSIDPERDTPMKLRETMERHSADVARWSMVRSDPGDLRAISGVFGVRYKQLPDGEFNHTTRIILLDREGTLVASTEQLGRLDAMFLEAIKTNLQ
jgi:protein SCO1/2